MKSHLFSFTIVSLAVATAVLGDAHHVADAGEIQWKAGTVRAVVTPGTPMWMAGYAARNKPSQGVVHDLWAKALALEDSTGKRAILITLDVCGISRDLSIRVRDEIQKRLGLEREQIVIACSHTHSGPVVGTNLLTMYKLEGEQVDLVKKYAQTLEKTLVQISVEAMGRVAGARLSYGNGRCDFAVNRRANKEADVPGLRGRMELKGPVDHDLPVLRVDRADGSPMAVIFGYACHCTVLDGYQFCGDYAGFAQIELEKRIPAAQAMFVAGCGADQNPIPRRSLELAASYGRDLATNCTEVLAGPLRPINRTIATKYEEIPLAFAPLPSRDEIERDTKSANFFVASRAKLLLETIKRRGSLEKVYPYPVQVWQLGELTWVFLGGEVVVDYSLRIKRNLGSSRTWVSAYCNDVMAYIPSKRVLEEGGYEGGGAMLYYGLPAPWSPDVEESIISAVVRSVAAITPSRGGR